MQVPADKKMRNLIIGAIKRVWSRAPARQAVLKRVRVEEPKFKKDGSLAARPAVFYTCEICGGKAKQNRSADYPQIHVDHKDPVVPTHSSIDEMSWSEYLNRLFCAEVNLQAICSDCHDVKTKWERTQRGRNV